MDSLIITYLLGFMSGMLLWYTGARIMGEELMFEILIFLSMTLSVYIIMFLLILSAMVMLRLLQIRVPVQHEEMEMICRKHLRYIEFGRRS